MPDHGSERGPSHGAPLAFDAALRSRLEQHLDAWQRSTAPTEEKRPAAVALAVAPDREGAAAFLLTRRAAGLNAHSGQFALPGGRVDPGETAAEAARRELAEELGLRVEHSEVLGLLDDYPTRSGYVITPVVLWVPDAGEAVPHPSEVAALHVVPLAELERPEVPRIIHIPESDRPVIQVPLERFVISAPTAALLYQFREVAMHGRAVRVDHFDQPVFAWE